MKRGGIRLEDSIATAVLDSGQSGYSEQNAGPVPIGDAECTSLCQTAFQYGFLRDAVVFPGLPVHLGYYKGRLKTTIVAWFSADEKFCISLSWSGLFFFLFRKYG